MQLKIIGFDGEQVVSGHLARNFTVDVLPQKGHMLALNGHGRLQITDVGFTQDGADLVATIWLSEPIDRWDN